MLKFLPHVCGAALIWSVVGACWGLITLDFGPAFWTSIVVHVVAWVCLSNVLDDPEEDSA